MIIRHSERFRDEAVCYFHQIFPYYHNLIEAVICGLWISWLNLKGTFFQLNKNSATNLEKYWLSVEHKQKLIYVLVFLIKIMNMFTRIPLIFLTYGNRLKPLDVPFYAWEGRNPGTAVINTSWSLPAPAHTEVGTEILYLSHLWHVRNIGASRVTTKADEGKNPSPLSAATLRVAWGAGKRASFTRFDGGELGPSGSRASGPSPPPSSAK